MEFHHRTPISPLYRATFHLRARASIIGCSDCPDPWQAFNKAKSKGTTFELKPFGSGELGRCERLCSGDPKAAPQNVSICRIPVAGWRSPGARSAERSEFCAESNVHGDMWIAAKDILLTATTKASKDAYLFPQLLRFRLFN
jgi:hypothetical protein